MAAIVLALVVAAHAAQMREPRTLLGSTLAGPVLRQFPEENVAAELMTLPVIHVERGLDTRDVRIQLDNRSDVAYYAQRK